MVPPVLISNLSVSCLSTLIAVFFMQEGYNLQLLNVVIYYASQRLVIYTFIQVFAINYKS